MKGVLRENIGVDSATGGESIVASRRALSPANPCGACRVLAVLSVVAVLLMAGFFAACSQGETQAESQASAPPPLVYIGAWGVKGSGPGELDQPTCMATDSVGNIYLADSGSRFIEKFSMQGTPLLAFQDPSLELPAAITIDSGGAIYVADAVRGTVSIYLPNGDRLRTLRVQLRRNVEDVLSIAVDDDGLIHIFDADASKVFTYTPRFRQVRTWQPAANVPNMKFRAKAMRGGPAGNMYLVDPPGSRIARFDAEGHFIGMIDAGVGGGERKLSGEIAVSANYIFAMDADGRTLHVWSTEGQGKLDADLASELGQASRVPPALAVSPRKELLVLDASGSRVLRYRINF